ncbi:MAG TPA: Ig-like domain-containing protein, partial [Telluria sp.]|nr:Ig-like domain-containing protein [Telluria sp.]
AFDNNSVTVSGGTLSAVAVTADPKVYTATFTPAGATNNVAGSVSVAGGAYTDSAGNSGGAGTALSIGGDTLAPTVTISGGGFSLNAGDSVNLTITFSEAPAGFTESDLTVTGGTVTNLAVTADPKVYTATFNPAASNNLSASVKVANASYDDAAGNAGSASNTLSFSGDTRAPTVTVSSSNTVLKAGETATISFTFSEAPAGFTDTDVIATGGTLSGFGVTADSKVYTATFTPDAGVNSVNASVSVGASSYADAAGNAGGGGSVTISADTLAPTLAITADKTTLKAGQASTVTFTFSEAPAGFDANDLTVTGGTLGTISATADPKVFTALFTPTATDTLAATISAGTGYTDANGNAGSAATLHLDGDTLAPGVTISASKTTLLAGEQAQLTFTFTDVPSGFTLADISASGGTVGDLAATADPKVFTATFVPAASNALAGSVSVSAGSYQDAAGNGGAASNTLSIGGDTQLPQVAVSADRTTFKAGQSALVTFTFTETPTGFTQADIDVTGGALSNFAVTADPKVYTALFTPAAGENSLAGLVSVRGATFTDGAGNANAASAVNVTIDGDTRAPDVSQARITLSGASGTAGAFRTGDTVTAS